MGVVGWWEMGGGEYISESRSIRTERKCNIYRGILGSCDWQERTIGRCDGVGMAKPLGSRTLQ